MSGWRVARSLDVLKAEIDAAAPGRSTKSDGSIGDSAHAESASDHNPNRQNVVCARDYTHDPGHGADMHRISRRIVATAPPALKYVIWDRQIWSRSRASDGWRRYHRTNPHTKHMHVSVGHGSDGSSTGPYDDTSPWGVADAIEEDHAVIIGLRKGDSGSNDQPLREHIKALQGLLQRAGFDPGGVDGDYGPKTATAVKAMLRSQGSGIANGDYISGWAYTHLMTAVIDARIAAAQK
jgi:hypothetical protein